MVQLAVRASYFINRIRYSFRSTIFIHHGGNVEASLTGNAVARRQQSRFQGGKPA